MATSDRCLGTGLQVADHLDCTQFLPLCCRSAKQAGHLLMNKALGLQIRADDNQKVIVMVETTVTWCRQALRIRRFQWNKEASFG